jgi:hypothetical protein
MGQQFLLPCAGSWATGVVKSAISKNEGEEHTRLRSGSISALIIPLISFRRSVRSCWIAPWNQGGATAANYVNPQIKLHCIWGSTLGGGHCYRLCYNAMLIQNWVITIVGGTSNGRGTISWDPMRKLHGISYTIHVPMLTSTFWWNLMAVRMSIMVGGKAGAAGSGTFGSFGCGGSAMGGGLGGRGWGWGSAAISG